MFGRPDMRGLRPTYVALTAYVSHALTLAEFIKPVCDLKHTQYTVPDCSGRSAFIHSILDQIIDDTGLARCQGSISAMAADTVDLSATSEVISGPQPRLGPLPLFWAPLFSLTGGHLLSSSAG